MPGDAQGGAPVANDERTPGAVVEEIIVTGSNIRGVEAAGVDVITLDCEYIELSGIATTTESIESLPQNFGLGAKEDDDVSLIDNGVNTNVGFASSVNLRGLGTDSTLTLLNGRRLSKGGFTGILTDISGIPVTAIEHVEILTDGASVIYGADAIAGVVNFIMRGDSEGAKTSARYVPGSSDIDEIQFSQVFGKCRKTGGSRVQDA